MLKALPRMNVKAWFEPWAQLDWWLLLGTVGLMFLGGLLIHSSTNAVQGKEWWQHWVTGGVGLLCVTVLSRWRYDNLLPWKWWIYGGNIVGLLLVMFIGRSELGAQRWINVFGFNVQPSEFAKLGVIITLAALLHERPATTLPRMFSIMGVVAAPWLLIFLEPNLGTSLVFAAITMGMLYWGNANPGWLILLISPILSALIFNITLAQGMPYLGIWLVWVAMITVVAWRCLPWQRAGAIGAMVLNLASSGLGGFVWTHVLRDYQKERVVLFLHPEKAPLEGGYHLIQSRIAIGAGQLWGQGLNQGTQTQLKFIPEQHTDFIFAAVGEELGFVGSILVLLTFLLICFRLLVIAQNAKDDFGSLIAIGVFSMIIFQTIINIGMTIGLSPVTGIPLPFLSYGRSALIMNFLAIGIVESVANHRRRLRY
jgi:rod shape determining protein RodA